MVEIRCYECKWFKRKGRLNPNAPARGAGKCVNPAYEKVIEVDAVDFCEKGEKKIGEG